MSDPPPPASQGEHLLARACACRIRDTAPDAETGLEMDPLVKGHLLKRLERIERQIRAIQMMVMDDDYCANIMVQITAAHGALRGAGREVIRNHLQYCTALTLIRGGAHTREMLDDVVDMVHRLGR